jgi:hypothetical protein
VTRQQILDPQPQDETQAMVIAMMEKANETGEAPAPMEMASLLMGLMGQGHRDYQYVTQNLIEGLQRQLAQTQAELAAIRVRVNDLFDSDYMPTESAIIRAVFYPDAKLIERMRANAAGEDA